ncbi:MAG: 50S ribosomal protein L10 [Candidatus Woesearchaeota archaeon]
MAEHKSTIRKTSHVPESKLKVVKELKKALEEYPIIAILNLENLPAKQLQIMKGKLRSDAHIQMAKKNLIKEAFKESKKPGINKMIDHLNGMPALLLTKENPFRLFKILKKSKSPAAIKPGQVTPKDIVIPAGPTPFAPGPIIGELGMLKIKAGIEAGKVAIKEDSHVAKKGDVIKPQLASLLLRLGIEPMEIGLDLVAVYENGEILTKDVLDIDEEVFMSQLKTAASEALNLAVDIAYPSKDTIELLVQKSFREAKTIAIERDILADLVVEQILAKANAQAESVKKTANL